MSFVNSRRAQVVPSAECVDESKSISEEGKWITAKIQSSRRLHRRHPVVNCDRQEEHPRLQGSTALRSKSTIEVWSSRGVKSRPRAVDPPWLQIRKTCLRPSSLNLTRNRTTLRVMTTERLKRLLWRKSPKCRCFRKDASRDWNVVFWGGDERRREELPGDD